MLSLSNLTYIAISGKGGWMPKKGTCTKCGKWTLYLERECPECKGQFHEDCTIDSAGYLIIEKTRCPACKKGRLVTI
jgi:RNA polymerase subunit RPABC4/transcription elongation factor Spt4